MDAIQVDGLTKEFDTVTAVDDLSFTVEQGEIFGLLGPNGAGKSTLINMLVTLLGPSEGAARVNGHDITKERGDVRDSLGIVFQEPAIDEELTGTENLAFHGRMYGKRTAEREERIPEVLELVDLADVADNKVASYSGGMQRRLEIGRGLMHEPEVLFLDEPTTGLDARTRRDTWEYIQRLNEESGVTIIITTHYMDEADFLCERVAIMDQGDIVAIDSPEGLKDSLGGDVVTLGLNGPANEFVDRLGDRPWVRERDRTDEGIAITLEHGTTRIVDLVRLADETEATISSVDLEKPSLENVFLALTGSTLTEREADEPSTESESREESSQAARASR
ncbi:MULTISPECIES: daunorubicin resistance protein DrrA family ABC transporter ATP-binding protein [Halococcus]|uniref:ABC transporter ATP-binding protein n=1 Tax=Halococcus salifodinae DSM 8989 TaxID=1227456 RepID=M0NEP8_9EURY|nr:MULTISPECIES: daunorubicin resistance protein DrrA family ABC transporter ATP-binding protein [Halococcus]EMA55549.1 ABC transporter ATP-binding protein [Halococcus salifodinae DSM 8989]